MNDSELTKKAVEELLRDINGPGENDDLPAERKKNPLGKPNKRFLGRTIYSMMKHNKRQSDNNHRRCQRKLKELDTKQKKRDSKHDNDNETLGRSHAESSHEVDCSDCEDSHHKKRKHKKRKKTQNKRKKHKSSSSSSSSNSNNSSSSESESSGSTKSSKVRKYRKRKTNKNLSYANNAENEEFYSPMASEPSVGYYIDPHLAYAAMAYGHLNQVLQQQMFEQQQIIRDELEESIEIPSDLSISYHSGSSLNISVNSSSAEEDENGVLTFKIPSSDEEAKSPNIKETCINRKSKEQYDLVTIDDSDDSNKSSVKSRISVESKTSQNINNQSNDILLLSSSTSDYDDLEVIESVIETKHTQLNSNIEENKECPIVNIEANCNTDEIKNILNTTEADKEEEIITQSVVNNTSQYIEEEKNQEVESSNGNNIIKKLENVEESDKNPNINKCHSDEINYGSAELNTNKRRLSENCTNTTMIDLTEEY